MGRRVLISIIRPFIIAAIICILAMGVLHYYDVPWIYVFTGAIVCYAIFAIIFYIARKKMVFSLLQESHDDVEETLRFSVTNNPLPLCLVNGEGEIAMANEKFKAIFPDSKVFKTRIADILGAERIAGLRTDAEIEARIQANGSQYDVKAVHVGTAANKGAIYYFFDVTDHEALKKNYEDEKPACLYIYADNYEDILQSSPDQTRGLRAAAIENTVLAFAKDLEGAVLRYRESSWQIFFAQKNYQKLASNNFAILDVARRLENDADFPTSFSIGIGLADSPAHAEENADYALDLARGRGGDQAVVKTDERVSYYGGSVQVIENRNKGKSRVMSHAIRQLISESKRVLIMGHKYADIDSLGASIALYRIA